MEEVERLFKNSMEEMEKLLTAKSVVGEPMVVDGYTIVPLLRACPMKLGREVSRHNELDNWRNTHRCESVMATK